LATASGYGSFVAFIFLTTLLMQRQLGYSPTKAGLTWLITSGIAFVVAGLTGAVLADKFGTKRLLIAASLLMVGAAGRLITISSHPVFVSGLLPALLMAGLAVGLFAPSVQIAALTGVEPTEFGTASGMIETSREFGGSIVIAVASTVLLDARANVLHGIHNGYGAIAIAAALGALVTAASAPIRNRRADDITDQPIEAPVDA
jgi:predicted MFS family arabinose efflux permease